MAQQQGPAPQHVVEVFLARSVVDFTPPAAHHHHAEVRRQRDHPEAASRDETVGLLQQLALIDRRCPSCHGIPLAATGPRTNRLMLSVAEGPRGSKDGRVSPPPAPPLTASPGPLSFARPRPALPM